jgi:DNA-directed RNA polymerase subunit beta'
MRKYRNIKLSDSENDDLDAFVEEVLEKRRREKELQPMPVLEDRAEAGATLEEDEVFENDEGFEPVDTDAEED